MIRRKRALGTLALAATVISRFIRSAGAQDFRSHRPSGSPPENHPKVDEEADKAALDRILTPNQKYDPWGNARPPDPPKSGKS